MELTKEQKGIIRKCVEGYNQWEDKEETLKIHKEHRDFFKENLSEEKITLLTEEKFGEI